MAGVELPSMADDGRAMLMMVVLVILVVWCLLRAGEGARGLVPSRLCAQSRAAGGLLALDYWLQAGWLAAGVPNPLLSCYLAA